MQPGLAILVLLACLASPAWAQEARESTAGPGVRVSTPPITLVRTGGARTLRMYLPPDYHAGTRRYPVLYMFDGQNLFDAATSYAGEWGVDEAMDALAREAGFSAIVVGIDHGSARRIHELVPYLNARFLPNRGQAFVDDVVDVVKPFIDANYRTLPAREYTAILGSSLGGLSADYAIHRHPDVFAMAGVFSPSYWVSDAPFARAWRTPLPHDARLYLFMGAQEGEESVRNVEGMANTLRAHPGGAQVTLRIVPDAGHDEGAWREAFPVAVRWLFQLAPTVERSASHR